MTEIRRLRLPAPAPDGDAEGAGAFSRELQATGCRHGEPRHFGDHSPETRVAQAFLETRQDGFVVAGLDIDHPARRETDLRQRRRKEVLMGDAPQHLALGSRRDPGA